MTRRSLSAPCATLRHVGCLCDTEVDASLQVEAVEAAFSLPNPRLRTARAAALFPSFTTGGAATVLQPLANSLVCEREEVHEEPVLFDRLNAANSQINLLNTTNRHMIDRCAELEEENAFLTLALNQARDENLKLSARLERYLKERHVAQQSNTDFER
ncbi:hypothetical protein DQ04_00761130 [Trypanosoma grayi]|uniref:hypothetical protein n=1 Tax=Trypanosoma grayi TaxID=71804 RepID=UPI0004F41A44|nr:hypothetical protein DQ04_00761130 [Trypanosoma grayi]KEG13833.1 hypothetical protein DQ04_00761130 [Trypanosoma grayi]